MTALLRIGTALIVGTAVFGGQIAQAQLCVGLPSLAKAVKVISTSATGSGSDRLVTGRFGMNGQRIFAGVHAGYAARHDFKKPSDPAFGLDVGYTFQAGGANGVELCPVLQSMYERGPTSSDYHQEQITTSIGLSAGRTFRATSSFAIVPFVQGGLIQRHMNYGATHILDANGSSVFGTTDKLLGTASLGLGFHLGRFLTLTPAMSKPFGAGPASPFSTGFGWGREPTYSISASFRIPR